MVNYVGDAGANNYTGTNVEDTLDGQGGADWLNGAGGHDSVIGGEGSDTLYGSYGRDTLRGGTETDLLYSWPDEDDDRDVLDGGDGDDFVSSAHKDNAIGGAGTDHIFLRLWDLASVDADLSSYTSGGSISVGAITFSGFERGLIELTDRADRLVAPNAAEFRIEGLRGSDTLIGAGSDDWLSGGVHGSDDLDVLRGETGNDTLIGGLGDRVYGGDGTDTVILNMQESLEEGGVLVTDPFDVDLRVLSGGGVANLGYGGALAGVETGRIQFASGADKIQLGLATIIIHGGPGNDTIIGGDGNDVMWGDEGNDVLRGGAGVDQVDYSSSQRGVVVDLNLTGWQNVSGKELDMLTGIEDLVGSYYKDRLTGNAADNRLVGGGGEDTLVGGQGDDVLIDYIPGFTWAITDRLIGGAGQDTLTCFGGDDVMVWASVAHTAAKAPDLITDLSDGDILDLQGIDANTAAAGDQAFVLVDAFTGVAGQLVRHFDGASTYFLMDVNGDTEADGIIEATGDHSAHDDFVL